jgi:hypothetical protein
MTDAEFYDLLKRRLRSADDAELETIKKLVSEAEYRARLEKNVREGRMTAAQRDDVLEQKRLFDEHRAEIEKQYHFRVVGYVNGVCEVGSTVHEVLNKAQERFPGRMVYFEPVGKELF